jgi:MerR family mercuric resistance operon transcriptional regulator
VRQIKALPADGMPIGELSRLCGVHIETIRYYEKIKMLPAPPRTESGHRVYGPKETRVLVFIRRGRELGFTLPRDISRHRAPQAAVLRLRNRTIVMEGE